MRCAHPSIGTLKMYNSTGVQMFKTAFHQDWLLNRDPYSGLVESLEYNHHTYIYILRTVYYRHLFCLYSTIYVHQILDKFYVPQILVHNI